MSPFISRETAMWIANHQEYWVSGYPHFFLPSITKYTFGKNSVFLQIKFIPIQIGMHQTEKEH